jgi:hypothetical protein
LILAPCRRRSAAGVLSVHIKLISKAARVCVHLPQDRPPLVSSFGVRWSNRRRLFIAFEAVRLVELFIAFKPPLPSVSTYRWDRVHLLYRLVQFPSQSVSVALDSSSPARSLHRHPWRSVLLCVAPSYVYVQ